VSWVTMGAAKVGMAEWGSERTRPAGADQV